MNIIWIVSKQWIILHASLTNMRYNNEKKCNNDNGSENFQPLC